MVCTKIVFLINIKFFIVSVFNNDCKWYDPHGYPAPKTGIPVRYQWKRHGVDPFIPNRQNATSPLVHRGQLRGSVLKASHTQSRIPMLAQRLSSATSSFCLPHFGRMTRSQPLQKHETTTFASSATSVHYRPRWSLERFRMWWWQFGWITATRCCRDHHNTTSRNSRTVSLELCSVLHGRHHLNRCLLQEMHWFLVQHRITYKTSVCWFLKACWIRSRIISTPYLVLTPYKSDRKNIPCWLV